MTLSLGTTHSTFRSLVRCVSSVLGKPTPLAIVIHSYDVPFVPLLQALSLPMR